MPPSSFDSGEVHPMLNDLIALTRRAHREILDVYNSNFSVDTKSDNTPVTEADRRAHDMIIKGLSMIDSTIPILSEEGKIPPYRVRRQWDKHWIVDPVDGTREFTERSDEFTVNIALVECGNPKLGVVGIPTKNEVYSGDVESGVALKHTSYETLPIRTKQPNELIRMAMSRHSKTPQNQRIIDYLTSIGKQVQVITIGSSIKACYIAEGHADIYIRFGPSNEWDIAAVDAVLSAAGGGIHLLDGSPKVYNQSESVLNSAFFACSSHPEEWANLIAQSGVLNQDSSTK